MKELKRFKAWRRFQGGAALEVEWRGHVLWEVSHLDHHHDARKLKNSSVIPLCLTPLPGHLQ